MARFSKRRKPRVQWLPVFGIEGNAEEEASIGIETRITLDGNPEAIRWDAAPVTFDYSDSAETEQFTNLQERSLQDLVGGNCYRLRRIVGKLFAAWTPNGNDSPESNPPCVDYAAGFIVCRTDDSGTPVTDFEEVNPLAQDSAEDPWIWRRRWFLRCQNATPDVVVGINGRFGRSFPSSTAEYGSVQDGPHIDQKTARRIDKQERLFFVQAARVVDAQGNVGEYATPGGLYSVLDYRLLGSILRSPAGNRGNASR